jgi:hypothetical protein
LRYGRDYLSNLELDYLGLTREEMRSQSVMRRIFHPDDVDRITALREQVFTDGKPFETEALEVRSTSGTSANIYLWIQSATRIRRSGLRGVR